MINTILAVDTEDDVLGGFYTECLNDLESFENNTCTFKIIRSHALNEYSISLNVPQDCKFIFLAYSHGSDCELLEGGQRPYISETLNIDRFKDSFFYTCACSTAKTLGGLLIQNSCASYIGYVEQFTVWDFNRKPFVECANYGFKLFANGDRVGEVVSKMKLKYDEQIDNYTNDFFGSAYLLSNKNALTALGNLEYSITEM